MKLLIFLVIVLALATSKNCPGDFKAPVVNLCPSEFPDENSEKVWFVKFYAPWCGHCKALHPKYEDLAKQVKKDSDIGIGAVDCTASENQQLCQKYKVKGYPTLKVFVKGKPRDYKGARETKPMKQFIESTKNKALGASKCPVGVFDNKKEDAITSLCATHFPDNRSKNDWVIAFYRQEDFNQKNMMNNIAQDLGNEAPETPKGDRSQTKQQDRLKELAEKYGFKVNPLKSGSSQVSPLAKVGAVCCDCNDEQASFCAAKGINNFPSYKVIESLNHQQYMYTGKKNTKALVQFALDKFGYVKLMSGDL